MPINLRFLPISGYEAYDRFSPAFQKFLEGLTAVHNADFFNDVRYYISFCATYSHSLQQYARDAGLPIQDPRGSPDNYGSDLTAVQ
jgi:hypothetical protein